MENLNIGDLWWTHFPFLDVNNIKRRPAVIVDNDMIAILSMYVTSQKHENDPFLIEIRDWQQSGLTKPSYAKIDKIIQIGESNLDQFIGELSEFDNLRIMQLASEALSGTRHEFSLLAIKNANGEFLQKYNAEWKCWLFPYFKSEEENKAAADRNASEIIREKTSAQYVTAAIHCKFSVKDQVYKIYNHKLYTLTLSSAPEHMKEKEFEINDTKYRWMSFSEMESDNEIMEKNEEVVAFVKKNCKQ